MLMMLMLMPMLMLMMLSYRCRVDSFRHPHYWADLVHYTDNTVENTVLEWLLPHTARTGEMLATGVEEVALALVPGKHHALLHHPAPQLAVLRLLAVEEADPVLVCDAAGALEELFTLRPQWVWK